MAVDFPSPAVDGQLYPDTAGGDDALENGRVYVYDAAAGIWNLQTKPGSSLDDFVLRAGDTMTGPLAIDAKDSTSGTDNLFSIEGDQAHGGTGDRLLAATRTNSSGDQLRYYGPVSFTKEVTTKEYVDGRDGILQSEIIKVQEEINAIIPQLDRGIWKDSASASPGEGHFSMRRQGGAITQDYTETDINRIIIHIKDQDGGEHGFVKEKPGDLIQLFDVIDQNYGLFEILSKDTSNANYATFEVQWLQGLGETHVDDDVLIRISEPPSGGTASEFVKKVGDDMSGPIEIDDPTVITDANHLINKGYVDDEIAKVGGGTGSACVLVNGGRLCADLPPPTWMYYINEGTWTQHRVQNFSATALYVPSLDLRLYRDHAPNPYGGALKSWKLSDGYDTSKAVNVWLRSDWPSGLAALTDDGRYFSCVLSSTTYGATGTKRFEIDVKDLDHYDNTNSRIRYNSTTFSEMPKWLSCVYDKDDLFIGTSRFDNYTSCYFIYNQAGSSTVSYDNAQDKLGLSGSAYSSTDPHVSRIGDEVYCTTRTTKWVWRYAGSKTWEKLENVELPIADVIEILYLDEVKRYVLIGPNGTSNWISQITEGPIDRNTFRGAIEMKHPDFEPVPGQTVSPHSSWYLPIVVHGEVIMQGNAGKKTINGVEYTHGTCYTTFDGHSVKHYLGDATNSGKADYNKEDSRGTAYRGWNHVGKSMSVTLENNKLTPAAGYADTLDLEVEVPYVQKLYWNGELLHPEPTPPAVIVEQQFNWSDQPARTTTASNAEPIATDSNGYLTTSSYYNGVWFPLEWLQDNYGYRDLADPANATWEGFDATIEFRTYNGIEGLAIHQYNYSARYDSTVTFDMMAVQT
jgi:hypothetical protein